jgi:hypothetical protein
MARATTTAATAIPANNHRADSGAGRLPDRAVEVSGSRIATMVVAGSILLMESPEDGEVNCCSA